MKFGLSGEQQEIRAAAQGVIEDRRVFERLAEAPDVRADDATLWREFVDLGWPAIVTPEEHGGAGLGLVELAVLLEELGFGVVGTPLLPSVLCSLVLQAAGSPEQCAEWLPRLADGSSTGCVQMVTDGTYEITPFEDADVVVAVVDGEARLAVSGDCEIEEVETIDPTRGYARVKSAGEPMPGDPTPGVKRASLAIAAESVGLSRKALALSVAYVKEREQFGVPIGAFQAISHRCADMLRLTEGAQSTTHYAAWADEGAAEEFDYLSSLAKAVSSEGACQVAASAIQVHGGIGFTWEAPLHWLYKRAWLDAQVLGTARRHRAAMVHARR